MTAGPSPRPGAATPPGAQRLARLTAAEINALTLDEVIAYLTECPDELEAAIRRAKAETRTVWFARSTRGAAHRLQPTASRKLRTRCGCTTAPADRWKPAPDRPHCRNCERPPARNQFHVRKVRAGHAKVPGPRVPEPRRFDHAEARDLRSRLGLSLAQLVERIQWLDPDTSVSRSQIARWETGQTPRAEALWLLATALGVVVEDLYTGRRRKTFVVRRIRRETPEIRRFDHAKLRALRIGEGLSQARLAERVGWFAPDGPVSQSQIRRWEGQQSPNAEALWPLASALGVTIGDLFTGGAPAALLLADVDMMMRWRGKPLKALKPRRRA